MAGTSSWVLHMDKWDGSTSKTIPLEPLTSDEFGRWFRWPAGSAMHRRSGPPVRHRRDLVLLVPTTGSWIARWGPMDGYTLYCDVTTPPAIVATSVRVVDLDLDVVRSADGRTAVVDHEEFESRRRSMGYPSEVTERAVDTASWLYSTITAGREPFATAGPARLSAVPAATETMVAARLIARHGAGDDPDRAAAIRGEVARAADAYRDATVESYLSILVERTARRALAARRGSRLPR